MPRFGKPKSYTDWLYSRPAVAFVAMLVIFIGVAAFERYSVEQEMSARRMAAEAELEKAQVRKEALERQVEYLESERGIEEEIRKHFDVAREGEQVIILMGESAPPASADNTVTAPAPRWYEFWR